MNKPKDPHHVVWPDLAVQLHWIDTVRARACQAVVDLYGWPTVDAHAALAEEVVFELTAREVALN